MNIRRGSIFIASLDPAKGKEIAKTRPVLVLSNNINNEYSDTITVLPITSRNLKKIYPFEVFISKGEGNLPKSSKIKCNQIRTLDKSGLVKELGVLSGQKLIQIEKAISIHLNLS